MTFASLCVSGIASAATRPVEGTVVMARGGSQPLFLWNATDYVTHLVSDKMLGDGGMHALEASALSALAGKSHTSARTVAIRVVYAKTGAVSPAYGTATFAGMENVLTITVSARDLAKNAAAWQAALADGKTPSGVRVDVSGALPPAQ